VTVRFGAHIALIVLPTVLHAATQTPTSAPRPWTIDLVMGGGWGGPPHAMKDHLLKVGGFDSRVCTVSCINHPRVHRPEQMQLTVGVAGPIGRRLGARVFLGGGPLGWTAGDGDSGSVAWHWSIFSVGAMLTAETFRSGLPDHVVTFDLKPGTEKMSFSGWIGAGPVVAWLGSGRGAPDAYPGDSNSYVMRLGVQAEAGIRMRAMREMSLGLSASYRLVPKRREGPYTLDTGSGVLAAFDSNYSLFMLSGVLGFHFRL
jgi:hypothetical protein